MKCNRCDWPAAYEVFAAYDAHYPAAMTRACGRCLADELADDASPPGSARQWVIRLTLPGTHDE